MLMSSNLTLNDAVKGLMTLIFDNNNVNSTQPSRKKRSTINTCFDLIKKTDMLFDILKNGSDTDSYDVTAVNDTLEDIDDGLDTLGCGCYEREKEFIKYQLNIVRQEMWRFETFVTNKLTTTSTSTTTTTTTTVSSSSLSGKETNNAATSISSQELMTNEEVEGSFPCITICVIQFVLNTF